MYLSCLSCFFATPVVIEVPPPARIVIPAGRFPMGARPEELELARDLCHRELRAQGALRLELAPRCQGRFENEAPAASVYLRAFAIDRTEVTVNDFGACVRARACRPIPGVTAMEPSPLPVERATFQDAADFCRWRGGRLPSEAEWEKAARGQRPRVWPWGERWHDRRANHGQLPRLAAGGLAAPDDPGRDHALAADDRDGHAGPAAVGSYPGGASPFGVEDMAGNVWEWTSTYFAREPPQAATRLQPLGPVSASEHTLRGGSYLSPPSDLRVTRRQGQMPTERVPGVGFRCAYDLPPDGDG